MKIGIDGRYLVEHKTGLGRYVENLIKYLSINNHCVVYVTKKPKKEENHRNVTYVQLPKNRLFSQQILLPYLLIRDKIAIYHQTANFGFPLLKFCKYVLTIHDLIPISDINYFGSTFWDKFRRLIHLFEFNLSIHIADRIICVSKTTKNKLKLKYPRIRNIDIIPNGISLSESEIQLNKKSLIITNIGGIEKRKNLELFIEMAKLICKENLYAKFYITGAISEYSKHLNNRVKKYGLSKRVFFTGYLNEKELINQIRKSRLICSTSLDEGFGLPIIEAVSFGVPIVASDIPAYKEFKSKLIYYFYSQSLKDLLEVTKHVVKAKISGSLRRKEAKHFRQKYNWSKSINETQNVYKLLV